MPSVAKQTDLPKKQKRGIAIVDVEADDPPQRRSKRIAAGGAKAATLLTFAPSSKESSINSWA